MKTSLLFGSALLLIGACDSGEDRTITAQNDSPGEQVSQLAREKHRGNGCLKPHYWTCKDARTPQSPQSDLELIDTLVPHHQMAIEMAEIEIAQGENTEVKMMAEKMKADQTREIEMMLSLRQQLTGCSEMKPYVDPHMQADMDELMMLNGPELDLAFIDAMIPHHAGAIVVAHNALPNLRVAELAELARGVVEAQSMEIGEMHEMRMEL